MFFFLSIIFITPFGCHSPISPATLTCYTTRSTQLFKIHVQEEKEEQEIQNSCIVLTDILNRYNEELYKIKMIHGI